MFYSGTSSTFGIKHRLTRDPVDVRLAVHGQDEQRQAEWGLLPTSLGRNVALVELQRDLAPYRRRRPRDWPDLLETNVAPRPLMLCVEGVSMA